MNLLNIKDEFKETNVMVLKHKYSKLQLTIIYNNLINLKGSVGISGDKELLIHMIKNNLN